MKTKYWILLIGILLVLCAVLAVLLLGKSGERAEIWSDGELIDTVDLSRDQTFTVETETGSNTVVVENGEIRVSEATCPDHVCIDRGPCKGGAPIVCLPNRLVIEFVGAGEIDGISG